MSEAENIEENDKVSAEESGIAINEAEKTETLTEEPNASKSEKTIKADWDRIMKSLETNPYIVSYLSWAFINKYHEDFTAQDIKKYVQTHTSEEIRERYYLQNSEYLPSYDYRGGVPDRVLTVDFPFGKDKESKAEGIVIENTTESRLSFKSTVAKEFFYLSIGFVMQGTSAMNRRQKTMEDSEEEVGVELEALEEALSAVIKVENSKKSKRSEEEQFREFLPVTVIWINTRPAKKKQNHIIIWPGDPQAEMFGTKYKGFEDDLKEYEMLRAFSVFLGDSNDDFLKIRDSDSLTDIALKTVLQLLDDILNESAAPESKEQQIEKKFGIPAGSIEAIEEVPNMLQTELVNQELRGIIEKDKDQLEERDNTIRIMDKKLFKANLELVQFLIVFCNHTLKSALDEKNIPMEERGTFVKELLLKYPDLLEVVVETIKSKRK